MHFFISYAKKDTYNLAKQLHDELTQLPDVTAWMDELLRTGRSWASQIERQIDRCDYVIVLLSPDVRRDPEGPNGRSFVLNEIDYAVQERKPIIPVMAQATGVPVQLAGIQYINFARNPDMGMQQLIQEINLMMGGSSKLPLPEDSLPLNLTPSSHSSQLQPEPTPPPSTPTRTEVKSSDPSPPLTHKNQMSNTVQAIPKNLGYLITAIRQRFRASQPAKRSASNTMAKTWLIFLFVVVAFGALLAAVGFLGITSWYNNIIEPYRANILALANYRPPFQTARIYDASGEVIAELNNQDGDARTFIQIEEMSPFIVHAMISQEDANYYDSPVLDFMSIFQFFLQNLTGENVESGASRIDQQIARNLILGDGELTSDRPFIEQLIALEIANHYDRNFLLELYLNEIYFGNQSYGVEAASQFYFKHGANELNFAESALLAGIAQSPATNDPVVNRSVAFDSMRASMRRMVDAGCIQFQHDDWLDRGPFCVITSTEVIFQGAEGLLVSVNDEGEIADGIAMLQMAEIETLAFEPRHAESKYPHFVNFVQAQIEAEFGTNTMFQRGFNIYTTLNTTIQDAAQNALTSQVEALVDTGVNTGAVMVTDPETGAIQAMVGSPDFTDESIGMINYALTWQQPGSSIKPIVYAAALMGNEEDYLTSASILWDVPVSYDLGGSTYTPVNFDRRFHGAVPLRYALQNDYNIAAIKAYTFIGNEQFVETAEALGLQFSDGSVFDLPSALGANEVRLFDMMGAYGTFANNGQRNQLFAIERISENVEGRSIDVPLSAHPDADQAISPQVAYLISNILSDDTARTEQFGAESMLTLTQLDIPTRNHIAAKTGTSNDGRDLWTVGYTSDAVVGVWLGTDDNSLTMNATGFTAAAPVWNSVMEVALKGRIPPEFTDPGGIVSRSICRTTGTLSYSGCPERAADLFIQDQLPPPSNEGLVQTIAIDSWTGQPADDFCGENVIQKTFANIDDASAIEWLNVTSEGQAYAQSIGLTLPAQPLPESYTLAQSIDILSPTANQTIQGAVAILGQVRTEDFSRYELKIAPTEQPGNFAILNISDEEVTTNCGLLGEWDTTTVPNGDYIIRLSAISQFGGFVNVDVSVTVDNPTSASD